MEDSVSRVRFLDFPAAVVLQRPEGQQKTARLAGGGLEKREEQEGVERGSWPMVVVGQ